MHKKFKIMMAAVSLLSFSITADAAIALDRTRVIYTGNANSMSLTLSNDNAHNPYLAQSWLEDERGNKNNLPLVVTPALQRIEPSHRSMIRINPVSAAIGLPQDRESVFWLNVKEIPPKSERSNVMQIALQTRIKMFYRPTAIIPPKFSRWDDQLILTRTNKGYTVDNPTPYFMTIIAIRGADKDAGAKGFQSTMIAPKSSGHIDSEHFKEPHLTTINDFGGKPTLAFHCTGEICKAKKQ
ncbi:molecular chaperone [Enterobacter sp. CC120223-11]|uniref:fimbrial biogenesis chaperone n=1 Tax=Enterobacter sp. CC120223-11 TaxID=1378073 RepID=UPI000BCF207B|nr:fimbria/pilus periplasmic chaperone [Enterobacter sp. CC120223-11]SNY69813.1 P pilus assembly protein, chaperone PapD [Enterobacter sp. CC120223-11]